MSYRVAEVGPNYSVVELTSATGNARFFTRASWRFRSRPGSGGNARHLHRRFCRPLTVLPASADPVPDATAIAGDLEQLKRAIET
jgi:hypothetical protein